MCLNHQVRLPPSKSSICHSRSDFMLLSKESEFSDYQALIAQQDKKKIKIITSRELVEVAGVGDLLKIVGIYTVDDLGETVINANNVTILNPKIYNATCR